jgi:hypothetical protein
MRRLWLGLAALALSLTAPALASAQVAYYPRVPCTAFNLAKRVPTSTALDSAALAAKCVQVKAAYIDSVLHARAARTASTSTTAARADSIARAKWVADSLRGAAVANPYPGYQKPVRPATFTATTRAKYLRDSLVAEYPVDGIGRPCWKYSEPEKVAYEKRYRCFRSQELDGYGLLGTLHTYFRGNWQNLVVMEQGDTKRAALRDSSGAPMKPLTITAP